MKLTQRHKAAILEGVRCYWSPALIANIVRIPLKDVTRFIENQAPQPGTKEISDRDFRTAMSEAYWLLTLAVDQETAARMRRQRRRGVVGATSRAEVKARAAVEIQRRDLVYLLAGLLGMLLPDDNAAMRERALTMCATAKKRSQGEICSARFNPVGRKSKKGSPVPTSHRNAADRSL